MAHQISSHRSDSMTVGELIRELQKLPADFEIGILTATGFARPPSIICINEWAWRHGNSGHGFRNLARSYLIRPAVEIV